MRYIRYVTCVTLRALHAVHRSLAKYNRYVGCFGGWEVFQALLRALRAVADRHQTSVAAVSVTYRYILLYTVTW